MVALFFIVDIVSRAILETSAFIIWRIYAGEGNARISTTDNEVKLRRSNT